MVLECKIPTSVGIFKTSIQFQYGTQQAWKIILLELFLHAKILF